MFRRDRGKVEISEAKSSAMLLFELSCTSGSSESIFLFRFSRFLCFDLKSIITLHEINQKNSKTKKER